MHLTFLSCALITNAFLSESFVLSMFCRIFPRLFASANFGKPASLMLKDQLLAGLRLRAAQGFGFQLTIAVSGVSVRALPTLIRKRLPSRLTE